MRAIWAIPILASILIFGTLTLALAETYIVITLVENPHITGIAIDDTHVYFTTSTFFDPTDGTIWKVPKGGGVPVELVTGFDTPVTPHVDDTHVYFSDVRIFSQDFGAIYRVPIDGGSAELLAVTNFNEPYDIAIDDTNVYFTHSESFTRFGHKVSMVPKVGGPIEILADNQDDLRSRSIAVDTTHVYFTDIKGLNEPGSILRVPKDGGQVFTVADGLKGPFDITVDDNNVYISEGGFQQFGQGAIKQVSKDGGTILTLVPGIHPKIDIDDNFVYYASVDGTDRVPIGGGPIENIANEGGQLLLVDDPFASVYFVAGGSLKVALPDLPPTVTIDSITSTAIGFTPSQTITSFPGEVGSGPITVEGTASDNIGIVSVDVNGIAANLLGNSWDASGIALSSGPNTITATAIDTAGLTDNDSVDVTLNLDFDGDGIENNIDGFIDTSSNPVSQVNLVSDEFDDTLIGGTTSGSVQRNAQTITASKTPNPLGITISADPGGGTQKAKVSACGNSGFARLDPGETAFVLCNTVTFESISGTIEVTFVGNDGTIADLDLPEGNQITFDPETNTITTPEDNPDTLSVIVNGETILIGPGEIGIIDPFPAGGQSSSVNNFLAYGSPRERSTALPQETTSFDLIIKYGGDSTQCSNFSATLNRQPLDIANFNPILGITEKVTIDGLQDGRNVLKLSIDCIKPGTTRTATDTDRLVFKVG